MAKKQKEVLTRKTPAPTVVRGGDGGVKSLARESFLMNDRMQIRGIDQLAPGRDKPTLEDIKRRQSQADEMLTSLNRKNREVAFYFMPKDTDWNITHTDEGRNRAEGLLDSTGAQAISIVVDNGLARLMPIEAEWFSLVMSPQLSEFLGETDRRLEIEGELKRHAGTVRKFLDRADFRKVMRTALQNFLVFGYCAVLPRVGMDGEGIVFDVFANNSIALEYAPSVSGGLFWRVCCTVRSWNRMHPYAPITGAADDAKKTMIHAAIPIGLDWLTVIYEEGGNDILIGEWHSRNPVIVGKMAAAAGETYPQGLGADNLTEVQLLNETRFRELKLLLLKTTPMFIMNSALNLDNFQFRPGGAALVDTDIGNNVGNAIAPVPVGGDSQYAMEAVETMRENTRTAMSIMAKAPLDSKGFRTAFEWKLAQAKEQEGIGEKIDAFRVEVMLPCIRAAVELLHTLENPPLPAGLVIDGENYDVRVTGTQEKARKLDEVQDLMNFLEIAQLLPPEVVGAKADYDAIVRRIMENMGIQDMVLSEDQADAYRAELVAAREQMMQQQAVA